MQTISSHFVWWSGWIQLRGNLVRVKRNEFTNKTDYKKTQVNTWPLHSEGCQLQVNNLVTFFFKVTHNVMH